LYQNAERTTYTFTIVPTCQVLSENVILVVFPSQISLPENEGDLGCTSATTTYFESMSCTKLYIGATTGEVDNAVLIEFSLKRDIPELETFSFSISNVVNPISTAPTDPVVV
jgi:hypothetical protein